MHGKRQDDDEEIEISARGCYAIGGLLGLALALFLRLIGVL